jgi:hypothetical protein
MAPDKLLALADEVIGIVMLFLLRLLTTGTFRTCQGGLTMSVHGGKGNLTIERPDFRK